MLAILIESAFRSLAIAVAVWALLAMLRIRNPYIQRTSWLVVAAASLSMPLLMQAGTIDIPTNAVPVVWDAPELAAVTVAANDWQGILTALYLLVCGALLARLSVGIAQTWSLSRSAKRVTEQWTEGLDVRAAAIRAPVTFASTILLPTDWATWSTTKLRAVLAHESAHVRNHDFHVQILAQIHRAFFWFSPLAWWLPKQLGNLSELISDDAAIERIADRSTYAQVLFEVARDAHRVPAALAMAQPSTVVARIERALSETRQFSELRRSARLGIAISLMPLVALAASGTQVQPTLIGQVQPNIQTQNKPTLPGAVPMAQVPNRPITNGKGITVLPKLDPAHPLAWPQYPKQSKLNGEAGTTYLKVLVGKDGAVRDVKIGKPSGFLALDESALAIARAKWQFKAGTVNNVPQPMWVTVPVVFKLKENSPKTEQSESTKPTA